VLLIEAESKPPTIGLVFLDIVSPRATEQVFENPVSDGMSHSHGRSERGDRLSLMIAANGHSGFCQE